MSRTINYDYYKVKDKFESFKYNCKWKLKKTWGWIVENKDLVMFFTPIVVGGTMTIVRVIGKNYNLRKEESIKNLYCYDRSLGHYWKLRRELSNKEWIEIDQRKRNGERLSDILESLKVLQ